uniref:Ig-like domain-containing protein n=1 Tax=Prevotella sp. GTC17262 TaxID=3236797 RepID=A0AB33JNB4_9BACT
MATVKARGQITIVDLNDAKQIQMRLDISERVQIFNPDTKVYTPNFTSSPCVVTPRVYVTGNSSNQVSQLTALSYIIGGVTVNAGQTSGAYTVAAISAGGALTIKQNITAGSLKISCKATYHDSETGQDSILEYEDSIVRSSSAGALFQVVVTAPKGRVFDEGNALTSLQLVANVYRGGTRDTDGLNFTWEKFIPTGGGTWQAVNTGVSTVGGTSTLTVGINDVLNFQSYRVVAKDGSDRAEAIETLEDKTDPYTVEVASTTGDKIVNGQGNTQLMARVYRGTTKIEDEITPQSSRKFTCTWFKYDKNGNKANWAGTSSNVKTGNPITVAANEIDQKATFFCEISQ